VFWRFGFGGQGFGLEHLLLGVFPVVEPHDVHQKVEVRGFGAWGLEVGGQATFLVVQWLGVRYLLMSVLAPAEAHQVHADETYTLHPNP